MDLPPREMKETIFTRHYQTVLPLLANNRKDTLQALHTSFVKTTIGNIKDNRAPNKYNLLMVSVPQCHSQRDCSGEHYALPRLSGGPATQFFEDASHVAGDIESNPGPKPTLKTLTHTQPPTITKYTNSSIQPPQTRPPTLSLVNPPPKTPTSVHRQRPPLTLPLHQPPHSLPTP